MPRARLVKTLTIYSKPGCHLCDDMKAVVSRVIRPLAGQVVLHEVDISGDANLEAQYGLEIPVLFVDGKKAAKYRVTEEALARILELGPRSVT
ncbi:MAG TPA: glutaredoxin family protein [Vicinamibacterales bacterium]|jgi:glutaredoxin